MAERRGQRLGVAARQRAQADLRLGAPGHLDLQLHDAEEPLQRAGDGVDRADALDRDDDLVGREHAAAHADGAVVHDVGRRAPAQHADDEAADDAQQAEEEDEARARLPRLRR